MPRQTGHTCEFGGAPNDVLQPQKILVRVCSCAWISNPMTGSNVTYTFGPAALTAGSTSFSNVLKFSTNMPPSFFACSSYAFLSGHVLRGSRTLFGTPGHVVGMSRLKMSCF